MSLRADDARRETVGHRHALADAEAFFEALCELDLCPEQGPKQLRADPSGRSWLPPQMYAAAQGSVSLREALADFVAMESALADAPMQGDGAVFTARVMAQVPDERGVDAARRRVILALAYGCAAAVAGGLWLNAGVQSSAAGAALESSWHAWLEALSVGGAALALALMVSTAALLWPGASSTASPT